MAYIGETYYGMAAEDYPLLPTVMSGLEIVWGAPSCLEHTDGSRARLSLWLPKTHESIMPKLGDLVYIAAVVDGEGSNCFTGKVDSVLAQDDHKEPGGYRINLTASDVIAETAKLRLSDSPWPWESVLTRYARLQTLLAQSGITLDALPVEYTVMGDTNVAPKDVDSYNALEAVQKVAMAMGATLTATSAGTIRLTDPLKFPTVLVSDQTAASAVYSWEGLKDKSRSVKTVSGSQARKNWSSNPSGDVTSTGYTYSSGTGGAATPGFLLGNLRVDDGGARRGQAYRALTWTVASTGGTAGWQYTETLSGASGAVWSGGMWVRTKYGPSAGIKAVLTFRNGTTPVGTKASTTYTLTPGIWTYIKVDGAAATGAWTNVFLEAQVQGAVAVGTTHDIDGVLLENTATAGTFFDGNSLDLTADITTNELPYWDGSPIVEIPASAIQDDAFVIDHANTVNQVKLAYSLTTDSRTTFNDTSLSSVDQVSLKKVPQQRSIESDFAWDGTTGAAPTGVIVTKANQILAAQSEPKWRLASTVRVLLKELTPQAGGWQLLSMNYRDGLIVKISGVPKINQYQRLRGGRIVLGNTPAVELEIEPVDYSAPVPITRDSLLTDELANDYPIGNFHNLTINDLRSIGPR
ncbi:hypothetical protein [Arthrobacter sp. CJ23]|uniref:hypothetical protein n=1 Tax=Arthrobacter sp. CJ23 TaxID=2972479 RepID=UPI00215CD92E|nr:hypothetical protein [Arthrobacter sp. CJ23]UVJ37987.1 hypothetical protein NVV90_11990 [Arthrobacter sp. CJ23]